MVRIDLALDKWWAAVNTEINLQVQYNSDDFWTI